MYTIEELEKTFKKHHKEATKKNRELVREFRKRQPGDPIPEFLTEQFSLPLALASICEQVLLLSGNNRIQQKEKEYPPKPLS